MLTLKIFKTAIYTPALITQTVLVMGTLYTFFLTKFTQSGVVFHTDRYGEKSSMIPISSVSSILSHRSVFSCVLFYFSTTTKRVVLKSDAPAEHKFTLNENISAFSAYQMTPLHSRLFATIRNGTRV